MFFSPIPVRAQKSLDKYFHNTDHPIERRKNTLPLSGTFIVINILNTFHKINTFFMQFS